MKKVLLILSIFIVCIIIGFLCCIKYYNDSLGPVSKSDKDISFEIKEGDTYYTIASRLESSGLIKSDDMYKIYLKINKPSNGLKVGVYRLKPNMGVKKILNILSRSDKDFSKYIDSNDLVINFVEGKNMRYIAKTIASKTNNTEKDVMNLLSDKTYLNELINTYWFIDKSILNKNIYYSLEGYLYPNTYNFKDKNVTVKEIFKVMLDETGKQLEPYKNSIMKSKYSIHQILTMASIVELEALNTNDRQLVAGVFYNRLNANMSLGSDVTTYYAAKVEMSERDLYAAELNAYNAYNTRNANMAGRLPIGPICNPSIISIKAAISPKKSNYYFFVADKNGKVYYTRTNAEHVQKIQELKNKGLWYNY